MPVACTQGSRGAQLRPVLTVGGVGVRRLTTCPTNGLPCIWLPFCLRPLECCTEVVDQRLFWDGTADSGGFQCPSPCT
eukprot:CAMPEP_0174321270 /NCGR_PEP_ID=MMETSP0810-20121108/10160_1 /TAXON_ID=73025 ORGANISM="Eutreptiella gymnastica-like, Strain CCMP1594" /NCGR_SAMPLE_ID=MMETSP0810 /ASSEMBLY_ACC=CAM_ASM_000659 /LENGTH=77 /DNA_ID=CAMNT_0015432571 /DNA_START=321 /DNA_END=554 /DNA_ORIENTATION=+